MGLQVGLSSIILDTVTSKMMKANVDVNNKNNINKTGSDARWIIITISGDPQ